MGRPAGAPFRSTSGVVSAFDEQVGAGEVRDPGGRTWPFHCTAIADGTRTIATGAAVAFRVVAGHQGRWEAADLVETGEAVGAGDRR